MKKVYFSKHADNPLLLQLSVEQIKRFTTELRLASNGELSLFTNKLGSYIGRSFLENLTTKTSGSITDLAIHLLVIAGFLKSVGWLHISSSLLTDSILTDSINSYPSSYQCSRANS